MTTRRTALAAGILYLLTFAGSIPTLALYAGVEDAGFVLGTGPVTPVRVGILLELLLAFACVGTAVALYPLVRRHGESLALGFVSARIVEAGTIVAGVVTLLTLVSLRQAGVGDAGLVTGQALVAQYEWFRLGQGLLPVVNAVLLGTLLYRSRLVPRVLPLIGLAGAPILLASDVAIILGLHGAHSATAGLAALPIAAWELGLGLYLVFRGVRVNDEAPRRTGALRTAN